MNNLHTNTILTMHFPKSSILAIRGSKDPLLLQHLSRESGGSRVWHVKSCVQAILSQARLHPNAIALRGPKSAIDGTYRELSYVDFVLNAKYIAKKMICFLADGKKDGLKGKTVAILLPRDVDFVGKFCSINALAVLNEYEYIFLTVIHSSIMFSVHACMFLLRSGLCPSL